ncbi:MAG: hypothetical protein ACTSPA_10260 [Promethearchaeota archaeon]
MKKNLTMSITLSIVLVFVVSGIGSIVSVSANDPMNLQPYDVGASLRKTNYQIKSQETYRHRELTGKSDDEGIFLEWAILDDWEGAYYYAIYELRAIGDLCEIWVQVDMAYPEGDPRDTPVVTDAQAEYLLAEFEGNIYPIDTDYFGTPDFHDGSKPSLHGSDWADDTGRSVILVSNVRDESYYDSSYPYYIAGFYSPTFEEFFDRNIISLDSYAWESRLGAPSYLYEAITAHEYQHLIHDDYNGADDLFMNEGCSMYAEPLCGYPLAWGDIDSYLATPDNSLVDWGDQGGINILADYGNALMWAIYLSDNYGTDFLSQFVQAGIVGIDGINAALDHFGHEDTFDDAFHGWRIANLIDSGEYAYDFMDLSETDPPRIYDLYSTSAFPFNGVDFGETESILGYATGVYKLGSYSTDYIRLTGLNDYTFEFDGDDFGTAAEWEINGEILYSTPAWSECDLSIRTDLDLTNVVDATLSFDTMYEIEIDWDFGFTQISTDNGETWVSLENDYTTGSFDPNAHPAIIENLPGLSGNETVDWINMDFDLSAYDGQEVILQFRYMTDWAYEELGWWITNIAINGAPIDVSAFYHPPPPETDFLISFIGDDGFVYDMELNDVDETGALDLWTIFPDDDYILMVVSATFGIVDYTLNFVERLA